MELYDRTTREGYLELDNLAGRSHAEDRMRTTLERAIRDELHAPLPFPLANAQRAGLAEYYRIAAAERTISEHHRLRAVQKLVSQIEHTLP